MNQPAKAKDEKPLHPSTWADVMPTNLFFSIIFGIGMIVVLVPGYRDGGRVTAILWVLACGMSGAAVGFLFGIPKILQGDASEKPSPTVSGNTSSPSVANTASATVSSYRQQVNTNLTDISDWLTKIIVGLSLVNLSKLPPNLTALAVSLAEGLAPKAPGEAMSFAYGLIVYFSVLGFLFGYLDTRLFLAGAFYRADTAQQRESERLLSATTIRVETLEANQSLIKESLYSQAAPATGGASGRGTSAPAGAATGPVPAPSAGSTGSGSTGSAIGGSVRPPKGTAITTTPQTGDERGSAASARQSPEEAMAILEGMTQDYLKISEPSYAKRVKLKDEAAARMTDFALKHGLTKSEVASRAESTGNDGVTLVLAGMSSLFPEPGDAGLLLRAATGTSRLHVKFRVLAALSQLMRRGLLEEEQRAAALALTQRYAVDADESLLRMVRATAQLLDPPV